LHSIALAWENPPQRRFRRTVNDALEVLRREAQFKDNDRAKFRIGLLKLPSADVVGLVEIVFDAPLREKGFIVSLPTCVRFRGWREAFPIMRCLKFIVSTRPLLAPTAACG
jgi:hypothetical protein